MFLYQALIADRSCQNAVNEAVIKRLTANIRGDLHLKLKIRAAQERTTIGELIEQWVQSWK